MVRCRFFFVGVGVVVGSFAFATDVPLIVAAGEGFDPRISVIHPDNTVHTFFAYDQGFRGGVRVATGDVNGDGVSDIITGTGVGGGHVKVFDGVTGIESQSFFAFGAAFSGGVTVAAGDVNGDGKDDIITGAGPGGGPHVKVFSGADGSELSSFFAFDAGFQGGVFVAAGDVDNDGRDDVVTGSGAGGGPHVKVFSGSTGAEIRSFFAYDTAFSGGVRVATGDIDGDGWDDIITGGGPGGGPQVKVFSGESTSLLNSFFAFNANYEGGVFVAGGYSTVDVGFGLNEPRILALTDTNASLTTCLFDGDGQFLTAYTGLLGANMGGGIAMGNVQVVPEPVTLGLVAIGVLGYLGRRKRT